MTLTSLAAIAARSIGTRIGAPGRASLMRGSPVSTFICPVGLPRGCLPPPGPLGHRFGAGSALVRARARNLCLVEGIERYSLQYRDSDADTEASVALAGCRQIALPASRLRLGHPAQRDGAPAADSSGCAAGDDLSQAALRGLLELCEHEAVERWQSGAETFRTVEARGLDARLDRLLGWLAGEGLGVRLLAHRHRSGAIVCICITATPSGDRPALGSAAGLTLAPAAIHACLESAVAWFNIAEIEKRQPRLDDLADDSRAAVEAYRGLGGLPGLAAEAPAAWTGDGGPPAGGDAGAVVAHLIAAWGADIAVFDLSRPETGIVTARVVRLDAE